MTPETILETVRQAGGALWVEDGKLKYRLPAERPDLIPAMRERKSEILDLLSSRPVMPAGVRLVRWEPKAPPIRLSQCETVTDTDLFVRASLAQLENMLAGRNWLAGNWGLSGLLDRLAAVGCHVTLEDPRSALQ